MEKQDRREGLVLLLMLVTLATPSLGKAVTLTGVVKDLGATSTATEGIDAVWVKVKNSNSKEIARGLTDGNGRYKIEVPPKSGKVVAYYEKLGYQSRPTVKEIAHLDGEQDPVYMVQEAASATYYEILAEKARRLSAESHEAKLATITALSHLPAGDRAVVAASLEKLPGGKALQDEIAVQRFDLKNLGTATTQKKQPPR